MGVLKLNLVLARICIICYRLCGNKSLRFLEFVGGRTLELYIGFDISKNVLSLFMSKSTIYWLSLIAGAIIIAFLYSVAGENIKYVFFTLLSYKKV